MLAPTTAEQRLPLYKDVEDLITVGFITHSAKVGEHRIGFRSFLEGDSFMLRQRTDGADDWRVWTVASSAWMVDGHCLLTDPEAVPRMHQVFKNIPLNLLEILFQLTVGLFRRMSRAYSLVEAFCYEDHSRYLWRTFGRKVPMATTGIPGRADLGLNGIQGVWLAFNQSEDARSKQDSMWEAAKLITSSMSPKGVQKIDSKDKRRRNDEDSRRQSRMDRAYYIQKGLVTDDGSLTDGSGRSDIMMAQTPQEMADEMQRWVSGEEDWHDKVVSGYKKQITDRMAIEKQDQQNRLEELRRVAAEQESSGAGAPALVAYTQEQLTEILRHRQQGVPANTRRIHDGVDPKDRLHERYLARKAGAPVPMVSDGKGGLSPLAAEVATRQVPFRTGPGDN